tara:strand:- start:244 stop:453 length:210 start_codon:yes stop_codon:yes gene_type:complete
MALENAEVLKNLQEQLTTVQQQVTTGQATVLRLQGAIDVLSQIEESKEETTEEAPVDGGEVESTEGQEG